MLPREVLKKIRRIEITTSRLVNDIFSGEYHSSFRGRGMEFSEVRDYIPGDDIRTIDWNVTARYDRPFVKVFREERELTVVIAVDLSASGLFGSGNAFRRDVSAELAALLAFAAIKNNDKVGLLLFTDRIEKFIPPRKGRRHVLRIIRDVLYYTPTGRKTGIADALAYLLNAIKKRSVIFLISDFFDSGFEKQLSIISNKHDMVAVRVFDPIERVWPSSGLINLIDLETGGEMTIDLYDKENRRRFALAAADRIAKMRQIFLGHNIDYADINTREDYAEPLIKLFEKRARRLRR